MDIINEIFKGRELTVEYFDKQIGNSKIYHKSAICTLDKWSRKRPPIDVPVELFKILVDYKIIELDSGNFETGEEHYILSENSRDISIALNQNIDRRICNIITDLSKSILREIRLNKILRY